MVTVESSLFMVEGCKKYNNDLLIKFDSNFKKNHHLAIMNQNNRKEGDSLQCPSGCPPEKINLLEIQILNMIKKDNKISTEKWQ